MFKMGDIVEYHKKSRCYAYNVSCLNICRCVIFVL
jgi:hypothetical protein